MENPVESYIRNANGGRLETVIPGGTWAQSWEKILPGVTRLDQTGTAKPREWSRWQVGEVLEYTLLSPKGELMDSYLVRWHLPELPGAPETVVEQRVPGKLLTVVTPESHPFPEEWRPGLAVQHLDGWQGTIEAVDWTRPGGPIVVTKHGAQGFRCAPRGWAPDKLRLQQLQQPTERSQYMAPYRFITERSDWQNAARQWSARNGDVLQVEDDIDGTVGDFHAVLLAPDWIEVARLQLTDGAEVFVKVRAAIRQDADRLSSAAAAAGDTVPAAACTAPPGAAGGVRAARQLGQALSGPPQPSTAEVEPSKESATSSTTAPEPEPIVLVDLQLIDDLPGGNHRRSYDPAKLEELTELVRQHGFLEPVLVRRAGDRYQLIAGYRRREAARRAQLPKIPARVRECTVEQARLEMYVENGGREDLNPMDEARAYRAIQEDNPGWTHADVAKAVGKRRQHVQVLLQLLKELPENLQRMVESGDLAVDTARQFLADTANMPQVVREKASVILQRERPSIRQAPEVIARAITEVIPRPTPPPAARAAGPTAPVQPPVQQTARQPDRPPAPPVNAGRVQTPPPPMEPLSAPPRTGPKPDPQVHHAQTLAEIGRQRWKLAMNESVLFDRECYLPLARVMRHWELRQDIGATALPKTTGASRVEIPELRLWFKGPDESSMGGGCTFELNGVTLKIQTGHFGSIETTYAGTAIYYRVVLTRTSESGGHKYLQQQLVIQDGAHHVVVTGSGTAMIRAELVPQLQDLVNELPGLPGAEGSD